MHMDLEARKISFVQEFLRLQNEDIINYLEQVLHEKKADLADSQISPMSREQFNADITTSLGDIQNNRITDAQTLKQKISKWR